MYPAPLLIYFDRRFLICVGILLLSAPKVASRKGRIVHCGCKSPDLEFWQLRGWWHSHSRAFPPMWQRQARSSRPMQEVRNKTSGAHQQDNCRAEGPQAWVPGLCHHVTFEPLSTSLPQHSAPLNSVWPNMNHVWALPPACCENIKWGLKAH